MIDDKPFPPRQYPGVMVSSTFGDLEQHRAKLMNAISGQGLHPVAMEQDAARPAGTVIESSLAKVRDAAAYIGVISFRYGQVPEDDELNPGRLSLAELEFQEARRIGRPILIFIMGTEHDVKPAAIEVDPVKIRKLDAFREEVKRASEGSTVHRVYKEFDSLQGFEVAATQSVAELRRLLDEQSNRWPELPVDFPPIHAVAERTGNLPLQVSSFIGRGRELDQTAAALGEARVVTLTGAGGVGKTRLALQVAGQVLPRFSDGAWLCELAPVRDPAAVDDAVAAVFSVTAPAGQSTRDALVEFLRGKQLLLVLDNCEHLLEAAAVLADVLQRSCERLAIVATSREGLGIEGERLVPVPPLGVPGADADLVAITQAEAVRLFAERAAAVKPEFAVTAENAAAVASVVRRLDGIALAIELAAARIAAMTTSELASRLQRSFAVLGVGRRGAVAQHQTLRATIDWSYQLLGEPEQRLLARLAVFAGGCTLEAAETVCGGDGIDPDTVFELLASLVAQSLVVTEEHGPQTRYRLLETIRQYGEERLTETGETDRWQARHADYYMGVLKQIRHHDRRADVFWAVRLRTEQDNLLAAWSWAIDTRNIDTAFSILAGFAPSEVSSRYPLLLDGEAALELPGAAAHPGYPLALAVSARFAAHRGDVTVTEELCRAAAEANERHDPHDWRVEEVICDARSNIAFIGGALADAARLAERAAGLARTGGDLADTSLQLGLAAGGYLLDAPRAVPLAREALTLARQIGDPALIATGLLAVGATVVETDPEQARACLRESLQLSTALGYKSWVDHLWTVGIAFLLNDQTPTLALGRSAIRALQRGGDRLLMGYVLHMIAGALAATQPEGAATIQGAAEAHMVESPNFAPLISLIVTEALGEERARELRARGADMDWDQAVAYTLAQTTQALDELQSQTQP